MSILAVKFDDHAVEVSFTKTSIHVVLADGREVLAPVEVGDRVIYKKWGGDEIKIHGVEYKLVKFDDLMAILED